jgi:hypothetical protein
MPKELRFSAVLVPVRTELVRLSAHYHSLNVFPLEDGSAQVVHSGAAVDSSALSAAVQCAFAPVAAFAECGAVPSAVFELHWCFSEPLAGVLFPAVAAASGVPDFV